MAPFRPDCEPGRCGPGRQQREHRFPAESRNETALCDSAAGGGWQNSQACRYQAQGRVLYSLISFPAAGNYTLRAAHDDNLVVELSADYANTNYRNASYGIPVGQLGAWTSNDETFETVGTFNAANANSCALIRVYWTSRAESTTTGCSGHVRATSPKSSPPRRSATPRCPPAPTAATVRSAATATLTLNKVLGSPRLVASDQFTIEIGTNPATGTVRSATTSGDGTGQQASTGAFRPSREPTTCAR